MRALVLAVALASVDTVACDDPGAVLEITDARVARGPDRRVVVDVDLLAREGLGGSVGVYCARATFTGEDQPVQVCSTDLEDGDTKTVRLVSAGAPPPFSTIAIRVRLGVTDIGRNLASPP